MGKSADFGRGASHRLPARRRPPRAGRAAHVARLTMCALVTRAAAAPGIPPSESVLDQAARAAAIIGSRHPFGFFYNVPAAFRGATCPGGALYLYGSNKYVVPDAMRQQILDDKLVTKGWDGKLSSSRLIPSNGPSLWRLHAGTSMLPDELLEALPFSGRRAA